MNILLPSPIAVLKKAVQLLQTPDYWLSVTVSFYKIMLGILCGMAVGAGIAVLTSKSRVLYEIFGVPLNLIRSTPVASFILMALVWVKSRNLSAFITAMMVLPIVWANIHEGIVTVDKNLLEVGKCYHFSFRKNMRYIYIPHLCSFFTASLTTAVGLGWKAGIAAEVIATPRRTIGAHLNDAKVYLETEELFAWTLTVILLSVLIQFLLKRLAKGGKKRED